jgi:hypothetical protein
MSDAHNHPFARSVAERLKAAGLVGAEMVSSTPTSSSFGDAEAMFRLGPLILRFVRDRGQDLLDVATATAPDQFFLLDDLEVAMGWRTIGEVLAKQDPESLDAILARLGERASELTDALSVVRERATRARIECAARERGEAVIARLGRTSL